MQRTEPWPNEFTVSQQTEQGVEMRTCQGKRVRDDVREGAAVAAFSVLASTALAVALTLFTRLG